MSDKLSQASSGDADGTAELQLRLTDWLWARWYAKCWWALIPVYWLAIGEPTRPAILEAFARSGYAVITHMIFNPVVAFIVLGAGYFHWALEGDLLDRWELEKSTDGRLPWSSPDDYSTVSDASVNRFWHKATVDHARALINANETKS